MSQALAIEIVADYFIVGMLFALFIFFWHNKTITVLEDRRPWPLSIIPPMVIVYVLAVAAWPWMLFKCLEIEP